MRRNPIIVLAALMLLAVVPASAMAHHHRRHHARVRHARIERFGHRASAPTTSGSTDSAGTVQSFSGGVLTIMLNDGSTVSGEVTSDTELECMAAENDQTMQENLDRSSADGDHGGTSGSDDQAQESGDQSSGDDQGDAAEQNEDQGEDQDEMNNNCASSDLKQGTVVHEAELRISNGGSVWKQVELQS